MKKINIVFAVVAGAAIVISSIAVYSNSTPTPQQNQASQTPQTQNNQIPNQPSNQNTQPTQAITGCPKGQNVTQTDANGVFKPTIDIANKLVTLNTSLGKIQISFYEKDAPKTVENFICLTEQGYYNNVTFHRVAHGFVVQGGDPTGTGAGGKSVYGASFEDELYPNTPSYKTGYLKGVVAMANSGPNTNGSQFFIMLADHPELPHLYTIFGKV